MSDWGDALYECWRSGGDPDALDREDFEERGHEEPDDYGCNEAVRQRRRRRLRGMEEEL